MKAIIIGRGGSCLRCTKTFVDSHDLKIAANNFVYSGYEKYVGDKVDIQFRNRGAGRFTQEEIRKLGLKKVVYSNNNGYVGVPSYYEAHGVEVVCPDPPIKDVMCRQYGSNCDYSTGMVALYYTAKHIGTDE
jgi:hypothetical protein